MGDKEQSGMLRSVVVLGLIAIIAMVIVVGVVGLKASLRTNTLMAVDAGHNLVKLKNDSISNSVSILNDDHTNSTTIADNGVNDATLTLKPSSSVQGVFMPYEVVEKDYIDVNDKWTFSLDLKTSEGAKLSIYQLGLEGSTVTSKTIPTPSSGWQHYEVNGTRLNHNGTAVIYFKNQSSSTITVDIKNVELHRAG